MSVILETSDRAQFPKGGLGRCSNWFETQGLRKKPSHQEPEAHVLFC